jgi:hypothetical protein
LVKFGKTKYQKWKFLATNFFNILKMEKTC